ncbi:unnamed protein product [Rotaria socialis]|uniref:Uncharacterized protein n=1 Tax=Rotaria socialis TaxID=392032 RepID=A0A817N925_9BILA|nr:unnamed protein product [Rotaria socialis]CAF3325109.1 unnamed protein product [Rotaria socialis]CAF3330861.1 unnamed protein product [Rotaria socialis]CAF3484892.1 unnamed protein product [Rotaria socialis]CAF3558744.1 unnamed protein product [Rotaria socialis]
MDDYLKETSANNFSFSSQEIRKFVNGILNLKVTDNDKKQEKVFDQTHINQLLLSSATRIKDEPIHETNTFEDFPSTKVSTKYKSVSI